MVALRRAKRRAALTIALADIAGLWDLAAVTRALTDFADACVQGALRFLLREAAARAGLAEADPARARSHHRPHRAGDGQIRRL